MNIYNQEQMTDLFQVIVSNEVYHGCVIDMFIEKSKRAKALQRPLNDRSDITSLTTDCKKVHANMKNYRWTKRNGNFPERKSRDEIKKVRDILFTLDLNQMPLHVNDPLTGPIAAWRLKNVT